MTKLLTTHLFLLLVVAVVFLSLLSSIVSTNRYQQSLRGLFEDSIQPTASNQHKMSLNPTNCWLSPPWGMNETMSIENIERHVCAERRQPRIQSPSDILFPYSTAKALTCQQDDSHSLRDTKDNPTDDDMITIVLLYYANPRLLVDHLKHFATYDSHIQQKLRLLIVDDGSPPELQAKKYYDYFQQEHSLKNFDSVKIARVLKDIPWNMPGTQNLGFHLANTEKVVLLDLDTFLPSSVMERMVDFPMMDPESGKANAYQFWIDKSSAKDRQKHPKIMFLSKSTYWSAGGYDEGFVGHYGHTDFAFWHRFELNPQNQRLLDQDLFVQVVDNQHVSNKCLESFHAQQCHLALENLPKPPKRSDIPVNRKLFQRRKLSQCWSNDYLRFEWVLDDVGS